MLLEGFLLRFYMEASWNFWSFLPLESSSRLCGECGLCNPALLHSPPHNTDCALKLTVFPFVWTQCMVQCRMDLLVEEVMKFHCTSILKGNFIKKKKNNNKKNQSLWHGCGERSCTLSMSWHGFSKDYQTRRKWRVGFSWHWPQWVWLSKESLWGRLRG